MVFTLDAAGESDDDMLMNDVSSSVKLV